MLHNGNWLFHYLLSWRTKTGSKRFIASQEILEGLVYFAKTPIDTLIDKLKSNTEGLTETTAAQFLEKFGYNTIATDKPVTWYSTLFRNFSNPFVLLLIGLSIISYFINDIEAVFIILTMVILSVIMRFFQEYRSSLAAEKLKSLVSTKASVIRRKSDDIKSSTKCELSFKYLVPGDIISLSAGDMLPADVRLISSHDLFVSQSSLTGESMPLEKYEHPENSKMAITNPLEMPNICLMGTSVVSGIGKAIVITTGSNTYFGSIAKTIVAKRPLTSFDIGINKVSWLLIRIMLCMVPIVFLINGLSKDDWFQSLLFALSIAVGLTPEMLPMIITTNLAKGALAMSKSKVVVKQLGSIQNFGAMDLLCTDKTGTLTQDRIILEHHFDLNGKEDEYVLELGYLNSYYQTGLKNLLDVAVLEHTELQDTLQPDTLYHKIDEIPFDFSRKRMSVVVSKSKNQHELICKGSLSTILSICTHAKFGSEPEPLNETLLKKINHFHDHLNKQGLRVLAVASKMVSSESQTTYHMEDEHSMTLVGLLAFLDPPKTSAAQAIKLLKNYGVNIKVLTGDNEVITKRICKWVGLEVHGVLTGPELQAIEPHALNEIVEKTTIFAKLEPMQKALIISCLKANGHTVGYLGDGINDAPALREADLGISVDTAVDIAKESSDIIMLEKSLLFLADGVIEGRKTFGNIIKYIKMAISSNFGNVFSILGASIFLPFLPMLPIQILLQNLLYDVSQLAIPFDTVDKEFLETPHQWKPGGISRFMLFIGPISSLFDYITFGFLWFFFDANTIAKQSFFQSGWFIEGLLSQVLIVHMIRTQKIPFIQSFPSFPLFITTLFIMILGIIIPYTHIGADLGMTSLPGIYFLFLVPILLAYCTLTQVVKLWFIRRFNSWL
ncbi:MAG: magnesium-translocating P-type ATPase [Chlamydiales bacterium]|nr:magnesium-translocating P-type ATPase [Chlamydiales bacterium]